MAIFLSIILIVFILLFIYWFTIFEELDDFISILSLFFIIAVICVSGYGLYSELSDHSNDDPVEKSQIRNFNDDKELIKNYLIEYSKNPKVKLNKDERKILKRNEISIVNEKNEKGEKFLVIDFKYKSQRICQFYSKFFAYEYQLIDELIVNNFLFKPANFKDKKELDILKAPIPSNIEKVCILDGYGNNVRIVKYETSTKI